MVGSLFVGFWAVLSLLMYFGRWTHLYEILIPSLFMAGLLWVLWSSVVSERLVVTEQALVVGSSWPFLKPYVLRYEYIVAGTLVPATKVHRMNKTLNVYERSSLLRRVGLGSKWMIHLIGPSMAQARADREPNAPRVFWSTSDHGRWAAGFGDDPSEVMRVIVRAAAASGNDELAKLASTARPRELTGRPEQAEELLPGVHIVGLPVKKRLR